MPDNHPLKPVHCIACGKIIAQATITEGRLKIDCKHCGVSNRIEAEHKPEGRVKYFVPGRKLPNGDYEAVERVR